MDEDELAKRVSAATGRDQKRVAELVSVILSELALGLARDGSAELSGLGTFRIEDAPEKNAQPASASVHFRPDALFQAIALTGKKPNNWKSAGLLDEGDFLRHPLWGYDLERGESEEDADETFVRPYSSDEVDTESSDAFFLAARVECARGPLLGALEFRFEKSSTDCRALWVYTRRGRVRVALGMKTPEWLVQLQQTMPESLAVARLAALDASELAPLRYKAALDVRGQTFTFEGRVPESP